MDFFFPTLANILTQASFTDGPFIRAEVEAVIKEMKPITAPGPDGLPPLFYQSFWSLIGDDICAAVLDCLNNCKIPSEINRTNITLIPKVKSQIGRAHV